MISIRVRRLPPACVAGFFCGILPALLDQAEAATVKAATPALRDVATAVASASDGDLVLVPAGTATWTSTLEVGKGITIQGATTITGTRDNPTVTDATVILDNVARTSAASAMVRATINLGKNFRLSGFTFRRGSLTSIAQNGAVRLMGTSHAMRVDHCHFDGLYQNPNISTGGGCIYGVIDHCVLDLNVQGAESFSVQHDSWGGSGIFGDGSWADDSYFGTEKFVFIEDCTFNRMTGGGLDCYSGGRYVARYNRFNNLGTQAHGTENTGRHRSARAIEIYNNTFNWTTPPVRGGELRGGGLLTHDNVWTGSLRIENGLALCCYREYYPFKYWGAANGLNSLDSNDPAVYLKGTAGTGSGANKLVVPNAGWATNQWVGYVAVNMTKLFSTGTGTGQHPSSWISSNTGNTINVKSDAGVDGPATNWAPGDAFEIHKVLVALDQPGRGKGALIPAVSDPDKSNVSWPNQALDPIYSWNNKRSDGSDVLLFSMEPTIKEGRDFYNRTPKPGYVPYTYPHPLTGPAPPSNLAVVGGP
jgi:hypothetical protein